MTINRNLTYNKQLVSYCHELDPRLIDSTRTVNRNRQPTVIRIDSFTDLTCPRQENVTYDVDVETRSNFDVAGWW